MTGAAKKTKNRCSAPNNILRPDAHHNELRWIIARIEMLARDARHIQASLIKLAWPKSSVRGLLEDVMQFDEAHIGRLRDDITSDDV